MTHPARYWHREGERIVCTACPRLCTMSEGQHGFCYVRKHEGGALVSLAYGRPNAVAVDPIEKKPLWHFLPGTTILSMGTAGCNLGCRFCQNWDISKAKSFDKLAAAATPERIATRAKELGCRSVAFTYNDPVIFSEYALDVAAACRELEAAKLLPTLMVDCSHANSSKQHEKQVEVARDIAAQIASGSRNIFGLMVESHLRGGAQKFTAVQGGGEVHGTMITRSISN